MFKKHDKEEKELSRDIKIILINTTLTQELA